MDPSERRPATPGAPRLIAILLAVVAATVLLGRWLEGGGEPAANAAPVAAGGKEPFAAAPPSAAGEPGFEVDRALQARIEGHVREAIAEAGRRSSGKVTARSAIVSVHVRPVRGSGELVSIDADRSLRPASNAKLVTGAAALVLLGSKWSFETRLETEAPLERGRLRGDLVVRAGGDPLYDSAAQGRVAHLLAPVVEALRRAGVARVEGRLVLDEGSYLAPGPGPGWPAENQHWQEHCALAGGFSANAGCLTAVVRPGPVGGRARSSIHPTGHGLPRRGAVKTVAARSRLDIQVGARPASATLRGEIPADVAAWESRFAHPDPVELFGSVLRHALAEGGVAIAGETVRERGRRRGRLLAVLRTPLADALWPIQLESNNAAADQLFLALGDAAAGAGTREGGARAVEAALERLGVSSEGFVQVDGSGLSRDDRLTARQLTALLHAAQNLDAESAALFFDTLPIAGKSGSLAKRMRGKEAEGRVHAKTGWISGSSALSGYVDTAAGERLCFSILVEYPRVGGLNTHCWKPMGDEICDTLVRWND